MAGVDEPLAVGALTLPALTVVGAALMVALALLFALGLLVAFALSGFAGAAAGAIAPLVDPAIVAFDPPLDTEPPA